MRGMFQRARRASYPSPCPVRPTLEQMELRAAPSGLYDPLVEEPILDDFLTEETVFAADMEAPVEADTGAAELAQSTEPAALEAEATATETYSTETQPPLDTAPSPQDQAWLDQVDPFAAAASDPLYFTTEGEEEFLLPEILEFSCSEGPSNYFTFSGVASGELDGMYILFGGEPISLTGQQASVQSDGTFSLTIQLSGTLSDEGMASARAFDQLGQESDPAYTLVHQTGV